MYLPIIKLSTGQVVSVGDGIARVLGRSFHSAPSNYPRDSKGKFINLTKITTS